MMKKLKIPYPVIVEGSYDKQRLEHVVDAQILTTDGFGIFNHAEKSRLIRVLAARTPIIVLTDSDGAGKLIRSHITSMIPPERLIHLYTPRIRGKEKRKPAPSAEGVLGVEGMENDLLYRLFRPYAEDTERSAFKQENPLCKADFYLDGLTGCADSAARRDAFAGKLGLPAKMTPNALLAAVRMLCSYEEYCKLAGRKDEKA